MILRQLWSIVLLVLVVCIFHILVSGESQNIPTTTTPPSPASTSTPPIDDLARAQLELQAAEQVAQVVETDEGLATTIAQEVEQRKVEEDAANAMREFAKPDQRGLEGDSTLESRTSRAKLLEDIASPHSMFATAPGFMAPRPLGKIISDTYEKEILEQQRAQKLNDAQGRDLDAQLGEVLLPECPLDGTFHQLRRFGHRLWYEGDVTLARACFEKGISLYLSPTNTIQPTEVQVGDVAPTDHPRYKNVLLETKTMREKEFDDFGHVVNLIQRRTERLYSMPWSPMRASLHDEMLKDGSLVHDPKLRALAMQSKQAMDARRRKQQQAKRKAKSHGKQQHKQKAKANGQQNAKAKKQATNKSKKHVKKATTQPSKSQQQKQSPQQFEKARKKSYVMAKTMHRKK